MSGGAPKAFYAAPPAPADIVRWPADFGARFTIFVDTEEEFDWYAPFSRDARATTAALALPAAHARFAAHGAPLSFMVDHPIVSDLRAVDMLCQLLEDGRSSIGTQLHPWVNPPFGEEISVFNSFPGNLAQPLEAAKLGLLTSAISAAFGRAPRVYRAGRYGIGPNTAALLVEHGYRLDSSMRARYAYTHHGGPDFSAIGNHAFRFGPGGALVELPLTTVFTGWARRLGPAIYRHSQRLPHGPGVLARLGAVARIALSPEHMPLRDAAEAVRVAVGEGGEVLNFSFHSPSLVPGHTPYVRDAADLANFWRWWDEILSLLQRLGVVAISADELIAQIKHA
ncbi:MAG: WalW protein [Sphingomonas sp.]|jgi:hypothetical protein